MTSKLALVVTLIACLAATSAVAQEVIEDALFCVGTTVEDDQARDWAYFVWQATDHAQVLGRNFAVYAKDGAADSTNLYARTAITVLHDDPLLIAALLERAQNLGDDIVALEERIDNLFESIMPDVSLTLPEKISAVIRGSLDNPVHFVNLVLLGRLHPGINLCIGYGHAERISAGSKTTFEVRAYDFATDKDLGVVGRVTVEAGNPPVLPAPGPLAEVTESDPKGHLNVKLRWDIQEALGRLSLMNYGFNVYRMDAAFAISNGFDVTPPVTSNLLALAATNPAVARVNELPVLKRSEPGVPFIADDDDLADGDTNYYFATALDILLRDGAVSTGLLVTVCDRLPPDAPRGVSVENLYAYDTNTLTETQVLKVTWRQRTNLVEGTVSNYYVYRWTNMSDIQNFASDPSSNLIAGPIAQLPAEKYNSYVDDSGATSPQMPADANRTFWYTVRAQDDSACGGNLSANSAPAYGVLRDRAGPAKPGGSIGIMCCQPRVLPDEVTDVDDTGQDPALAYYHFSCDRADPGIRWAEFYFGAFAPSNKVARLHFGSDTNRVEMSWTTARAEVPVGAVLIHCVVGSADGRESIFTTAFTVGPTPRDFVRNVPFSSWTDCDRQILSWTEDDICRRHYTTPPGGGSNKIFGIEICLDLTPGTKEYRVYCRVGLGEPSLIAQAEADFDVTPQVCLTNTTLPASPDDICYYAQTLDEHGNASPLTLISGSCFPFSTLMPTPMLAPPTPTGTALNPAFTVRWFCPPYGVERFHVWVAAKGGASLPAQISSDLSSKYGSTETDIGFIVDGGTTTNDFFVYRTPRVGPGFGNGAEFEVSFDNVEVGVEYCVFILAVGKDGGWDHSRRSNAESGQWTSIVASGPLVPWPDLPLPDVKSFHPNIRPYVLPFTAYRLGVLIGEIDETPLSSGEPPAADIIDTHKEPLEYLYTNSVGEKLFPVAMYRYQTPNAAFPVVSGDIVQVTPLMEDMAWVATNQGPQSVVEIHDPFVVVYSLGVTPALAELFLLDLHPAVNRASYKYLLVRFRENGDIADVIPTTSVLAAP